jgi:hypothetical protein
LRPWSGTEGGTVRGPLVKRTGARVGEGQRWIHGLAM